MGHERGIVRYRSPHNRPFPLSPATLEPESVSENEAFMHLKEYSYQESHDTAPEKYTSTATANQSLGTAFMSPSVLHCGGDLSI